MCPAIRQKQKIAPLQRQMINDATCGHPTYHYSALMPRTQRITDRFERSSQMHYLSLQGDNDLACGHPTYYYPAFVPRTHGKIDSDHIPTLLHYLSHCKRRNNRRGQLEGNNTTVASRCRALLSVC